MTPCHLLLLALTGNWGKKGTASAAGARSMFDGTSTLLAKSEAGVEARTQHAGGDSRPCRRR